MKEYLKYLDTLELFDMVAVIVIAGAFVMAYKIIKLLKENSGK